MTDFFDFKAPRLPRNGRNVPMSELDLLKDLSGQHLQVVTPKSPMPYRRAVYKLAIAFRREFGYDFIQYDVDDNNEKDKAFLWTNGSNFEPIAIGAASFRWRTEENVPAYWALQWVWIHPYRRGNGLLSAAWPVFKKHFGEFEVEPPLSFGMEGFMKSMKEDAK